MRSFLTRCYPLAFLALVICGPVLLLPHTMPAFLFVAVVDAGLSLVLGSLVSYCYFYQAAAPEHFQEATIGQLEKIVGKTRVQKARYYLNSAFRFSAGVLMVVTAHPFFGGFSLLSHLAIAAYLRLLAKAEAARK